MLSTLFSLAALPLMAAASDLDIPMDNRMVQQPGILRYPIKTSGGAAIHNNRRRQIDGGLTSQKTGYFYSIEVEMGTPGQKVSVNFDTGSNELWVNPVCSKSVDPEFCNTFGRFDNSSSFTDVNKTGGVSYGTGFVDFEYGYDYVSIGSAKISQQMFGVATDSEFATTGILGAGPDLKGWNSPYPTIIDNLAQQGFTNSRAFSLDLRSIEHQRGSVVFGGIDTKKFSGELVKRPIIPASESPDGNTRFWIYLDGLSVTTEEGEEVTALDISKKQAVLLDSGATISSLPRAVVDKIVSGFPGAKQNESVWEVECPTADSEATVNFKFGDLVINAPYIDFVWQQPENNACVLGVTVDDEFPVLGDTFLRSAYVVYDWDNRNIHLANNEDCGSKLVAIGKGPDAVPSVSGECSPATTTSALPTSTEPATSTSEPITSTLGHNTTEPVTTEPLTTSDEPVTSTHGSNSTEPITTSAGPVTSVGPITTGPVTTSGWHNSSAPITPATPTTSGETVTSTVITSKVHTITACPPYVTNCPVGQVTTEIITSLTTFCPGNTAAPPPPTTTPESETSTYTTTKVHTVTDCGPNGPCSEAVTTEVLTKTTLVCPQSTATWTLPTTYSCSKGKTTCAPKPTSPGGNVVTVVPITTKTVVVPVPGCTDCNANPPAPTQPVAPPPPYTAPAETTPVATVPAQPTPVTPPAQTIPMGTNPVGVTTIVKPTAPCPGCTDSPNPPPVEGAAAEWRAPGVAAIAIGALAVVAL